MGRVFAGVVVAFLLAVGPAHAATQHGFISTRDGTQLRYSLDLPDGKGPFPVVMNYEGYAAGSSPGDNGVAAFEPDLLQRGYAVMGVSVRGTGCSEGTFDLFGPTLGLDGYDAVEWAARQPWSNGHVGMLGVSFGGIMQFSTAATRPPHLDAIVPSSATSDFYRDVLYPGGILEYDFPYIWTGLQKAEYVPAVQYDPEPLCAAKYLAHEPSNVMGYAIPQLASQHAYDDDFWRVRRPSSTYANIDVPIFMLNQWQDEQLPARIFEVLDTFSHPDQVWANFSNGNHGRDYSSETARKLELDFLDHVLRGVANEFPDGVPHLMLDMETAIKKGDLVNEPSWRIGLPSVRGFAPHAWSLPLGPGGTLGADTPKSSAPDSYAYPRVAAEVLDPVPGTVSTGQILWKLPFDKSGALAYTSGPLSRDAVVAGPASLDLWLSSTATDTDIQATVTEVRPDGQETYVQRGWLRASARALDEQQSTALRPYHPYTKAAEQLLTPGRPTLLRVPVFPFAHAFRKGSRIRVTIDAPTSHTGFWAFLFNTTPATNSVLHDAAHPSRLMVGLLPRETARAPLPACDALTNQPCRANAWPAMPAAALDVPVVAPPAPRPSRAERAGITFPRQLACGTSRVLRIRRTGPHGWRLIGGSVRFAGHRSAVRPGRAKTVRIRVAALRARRGTLRLTLRYRGNHTLTFSKVYRGCTGPS